MSFKDIPNLKLSYNSLRDDIPMDFYIPVLKEACLYRRAVGFFSSNVLLQISQGLGALADNKGKVRLLVSPRIEKEDYEAIKKGYEAREFLSNRVIEDFDFDIDFEQKEARFDMLANMIAKGLLEIKVVALKENNDIAMFHRKIGIMDDIFGNQIAFTGSNNETYNGLNLNDESLDVYTSWSSDNDQQRCMLKEMDFERVWNGEDKNLITIPFPEVIKNKLLTYKTDCFEGNFAKIDDNFKEYIERKRRETKAPQISDKISLFDYQKEAISSWVKHDYRGIFDMATGTGKTFTAGGAICKLYDDKKRLVVFVCCPFTHLVDQWCDELKYFNIDAIKCYGTSNYEKHLERALIKFKQKRTNFVCAVITNASFRKDKIQNLILPTLSDTLLVVDEAHNFGSLGLSKTLNVNYPYRLALSATLDRYGDEAGTRALYDFFGEKCISYSLERAINEGKLTPYMYYPVIVSLTDDEYEQYVALSKEIAKYVRPDDELSETAKMLLIKRARIVAGASNKIDALREKIKPYKDQANILVYCGAVKYNDSGSALDEAGERQINAVLNLLNNELDMTATKFTADENTITRNIILSMFKQEDIKALVAIKCLDEGMNIPAIRTAFILASSTNPKEYIQRRGRVLRRAPNKRYAEIYDFITLPRPFDRAIKNPETKDIEKNLVRKELTRVEDFVNISKNPSASNDIINGIRSAYKLDILEKGEELYE